MGFPSSSVVVVVLLVHVCIRAVFFSPCCRSPVFRYVLHGFAALNELDASYMHTFVVTCSALPTPLSPSLPVQLSVLWILRCCWWTVAREYWEEDFCLITRSDLKRGVKWCVSVCLCVLFFIDSTSIFGYCCFSGSCCCCCCLFLVSRSFRMLACIPHSLLLFFLLLLFNVNH